MTRRKRSTRRRKNPEGSIGGVGLGTVMLGLGVVGVVGLFLALRKKPAPPLVLKAPARAPAVAARPAPTPTRSTLVVPAGMSLVEPNSLQDPNGQSLVPVADSGQSLVDSGQSLITDDPNGQSSVSGTYVMSGLGSYSRSRNLSAGRNWQGRR